MSERQTSIQQGSARTLLTDEDFIISARKACANSIMNTATGAYLDEALQRLERNQTEIKRLRDHAKSLTKHCSDRTRSIERRRR